jgi:deoxyribonuclease V
MINKHFSLNAFIKKQEELANQVIRKDTFANPKLICGLDIAYARNSSIAAAVTLNIDTLAQVEKKTIPTRIFAPYLPTFLGLREVPPMVQVVNELDNKPDMLMVDSNGILHPRRAGAASQLGIALDIPTIGVAKKLLLGTLKRSKIFDLSIVYDEDEILGAQLTSPSNSHIYISIGHKVTLETAINITKQVMKNHRMPEPIFLAHSIAKRIAANHKSSK